MATRGILRLCRGHRKPGPFATVVVVGELPGDPEHDGEEEDIYRFHLCFQYARKSARRATLISSSTGTICQVLRPGCLRQWGMPRSQPPDEGPSSSWSASRP